MSRLAFALPIGVPSRGHGARDAQALTALKVRLVDEVTGGDQASEEDHSLGGKRMNQGTLNGKTFRFATQGGSISYIMRVLLRTAR